MAFAFDTLAYTRRLQDGGIPAKTAPVHADAAREFVMTELVTESDREVVRRDLDTSIAHHVQRLETADAVFRKETKESFLAVRRDMAAAMKNLEDRVTVKMGFMLATAIAILAGIIKL
jgi:hypothetical protein